MPPKKLAQPNKKIKAAAKKQVAKKKVGGDPPKQTTQNTQLTQLTQQVRKNNDRSCPISLDNIGDIPLEKRFFVNGCKNVYNIDHLGEWVFYFGHTDFPHNRVNMSAKDLKDIWNKYHTNDKIKYRYIIDGNTIKPKDNAAQAETRRQAHRNAMSAPSSMPIDIDNDFIWEMLSSRVPVLGQFISFWRRRGN
jgi:hypothetical protein